MQLSPPSWHLSVLLTAVEEQAARSPQLLSACSGVTEVTVLSLVAAHGRLCFLFYSRVHAGLAHSSVFQYNYQMGTMGE